MKKHLLLILALLFCSPAHGAEKGKEKEKTPRVEFIDLTPVALPIVAEGRLVNYSFTVVRINLTKSADMLKVRAKEPYFRDALVRVGSRTPFTGKKDYLAVDETRVVAVLYPEVVRIMGPGMIKNVEVVSQLPKRRMGLPKMTDLRGNSEIHP